MDESGTFLNERPVTTAELKSGLQELQAANPDLAVVVAGTDSVEYQGMVSVMDVLHQLNITKIGLATRQLQGAKTTQ